MERLIKDWGGTAKLQKGGIKLLGRRFKAHVIEVPHVLRVEDGEFMDNVPTDEIESIYVFEDDVAVELVIDEFGRKDARYAAHLADRLFRIEWTANIVLIWVTIFLSFLSVRELPEYLGYGEDFVQKAGLFMAVLAAAMVVAIIATLLFTSLYTSSSSALWDYRARLARQFVRLAALKGRKTTLNEILHTNKPTFCIIIWRTLYPYVSEHIILPKKKQNKTNQA